jgi:hypothetical protein
MITLMPGLCTSSREANASAERLGGAGVRAEHQHLGQLAVHQLLEQPGRVGRQPAGRQDRDVAVDGVLDPQGQLLVGGGQHHAAHQ